jgi:hypothetical protein
MDITREQRRAATKNLDPELKDALLSDATDTSIQEITQTHSIKSESVPLLVEEIANVMTGLRNPNEFIPALQRKLGITAQTAQLLANDINTRIFKPVRIPLLKMFGISDNGKQVAQAAQTPSISTKPAYQPTSTPIAPAIQKPVQPAAQRATPTPTPAAPATPIRIPTIVPPPGIGTRASDQPQPVNKPAQPAQASQFVQYQPLKQNPFEIKPIPTTPSTISATNQPLNPNALNASSPQVHTLKDDIKNMTIVQQKLQNVVSAPKKTIEWTKPEIKIGANGTYTTDPYREPPQP